MKELLQALHKAQSEMGALVKNAKNPFHKSTYATLDQVMAVAKDIYMENGLLPIGACGMIGDQPVESLDLIHVETGQLYSQCLDQVPTIPLICNDSGNAQALKSARTYARRQLWETISNLAPVDDDDGERATRPAASQGASKVTQPAQDPLALLKPHETAIIAFAASKGTIIAGVHELPSSWLRDPQKLITTANEYATKNTVTKEVAK